MACNEFGTASFKGIEFEILPVTYSGGRRVLSHTYPFSDLHYNEDLGDQPYKFSIKGRFHGDNFRDQQQAAERAWRSAGVGVYFDPTLNRNFECTLTKWSFDLNHKKLDSVDFSLELVEKADDPYPWDFRGGLGAINSMIDEYNQIATDVYSDITQIVAPESDMSDGMGAGLEYVGDSARQTIPADDYVSTRNAISDAEVTAQQGLPTRA